MTILYRYHHGLYVNMTNRCPCACTFCLRQTRDEMDHSGSLWLEREPSVEEVKAEFEHYHPEEYSEVVFCGFGEPTERIYDVLEVAEFVKETYHKKTRINTNGLGNLIHNTDITPLFKGKIDCVSISLNTSDPEQYDALTRSKFGSAAFGGMLDFARKVSQYVPEVIMTTVSKTITTEDEKRCQAICSDLGVRYRIRDFEE